MLSGSMDPIIPADNAARLAVILKDAAPASIIARYRPALVRRRRMSPSPPSGLFKAGLELSEPASRLRPARCADQPRISTTAAWRCLTASR